MMAPPRLVLAVVLGYAGYIYVARGFVLVLALAYVTAPSWPLFLIVGLVLAAPLALLPVLEDVHHDLARHRDKRRVEILGELEALRDR